jgi:dGTPase
MTIRERTEQIEEETLSPYAAMSKNSTGRLRPEEPDPVRTVYQRDRDRVLHSKAFRRLKHKFFSTRKKTTTAPASPTPLK